MRLTILGKSPSWQDAGGACSGYLIEDEGVRLLVDCGNGVFAKLRHYSDYVGVDAVLISHLHADHFLDLVPFAYALRYGPRAPRLGAGPRLYAPTGATEVFRRVVGAWGDETLIEGSFGLVEYGTEEELHVGPLRLRFQAVPHFTATNAIEVAADDGAGPRITYGADHGPTAELAAFARDTDLLLIEATLPEPEPELPRGHLTAAEAGAHGRDAGARRLVLTHLTDELDAERARAEAEQAFGGPVEIAREGATYTV